MAGGRPIEYSDKVLTQARAYLKSCKDKIETFHSTRGLRSNTYNRLVRVKIPTIEGLAVHLGIARETVYDWERKYEEFSDILEELRARQAEALIEGGLSGDYNPTIAKVLLTKHGYAERTELTGANGDPLFDDKEAKEKGNTAIQEIVGRGDTE